MCNSHSELFNNSQVDFVLFSAMLCLLFCYNYLYCYACRGSGLKAINKIIDLIHANCDCTRSGCTSGFGGNPICNDGTMAWRRIPCYWPFGGEFTGERWIFFTEGSCGVLLFLLCKGFWTNNRDAADLRHHDPHITSLKWNFYRAISSTTYLHPISVISWSISVSCLFQFYTCITWHKN